MYSKIWASWVAQWEESTCQCRRPGFDPWVGKIPWRRAWQPTPVFLPGESHRWRNLVGYNPLGHEESDTTERLHFHFSLSAVLYPVPWFILLHSIYILLCVGARSVSHVQLFVTPWTVARQAPPSMGFSRQEYWSGLPFPSRGDLPDPGIKPRSPAFQADTLTSEPLFF